MCIRDSVYVIEYKDPNATPDDAELEPDDDPDLNPEDPEAPGQEALVNRDIWYSHPYGAKKPIRLSTALSISPHKVIVKTFLLGTPSLP